MARQQQQEQGRDRIGMILSALYFAFLAAAVLLIGRIIYIQWIWTPDKDIEAFFRPQSIRETLYPERGAIISHDGRLLAVSTPMYQIYMDCTVLKEAHAYDRKDGAAREQAWREKARELCDGLASVYRDKTAEQYYNLILEGREKGSRYLKLGHMIDHETLQTVKGLPLFREGQYKGGMIIEKKDTRQYPYGTLARRTIGYVKDNSNSNGNNHIGLEGKFDYVLHGTEGQMWLRTTDNRGRIQDFQKGYKEAVDGMDVRTTLNIDLQDIADKALRRNIAENEDIEGGCVVVLDVKTGAVRAMVNLLRDSTSGRVNEVLNMAIGRKGEPGSVFKTSTLMTVIEDGIIHSLDDKIPSNHGFMKGFPGIDDHITQYERANGGAKEIPIIEGFKVSSNYMFRYLAVTNYARNPKKFLDKIYMYKLGEAFDFDLEGMATPSVPSPDSKYWSATDLGQVAIGYNVSETPLHIVTFYNAIANRGRMMKPYLVESIEQHGVVKKKLGPSVLNASICSPATADTLVRGLRSVIEEGTAKRLRNCKWEVAGKTGTSWVVLSPAEAKGSGDPYRDAWGRKKNQATFVGFFPADAPRYTAIVTIYSRLSAKTFYGGTIPAMTMGEIVDNLYAMDNAPTEVLTKKGAFPEMVVPTINAPEDKKKPIVPDVKGMGLEDAVYAIENAGYRCEWTGTGHVAAQSPAAGGAKPAGTIINLTRK